MVNEGSSSVQHSSNPATRRRPQHEDRHPCGHDDSPTERQSENRRHRTATATTTAAAATASSSSSSSSLCHHDERSDGFSREPIRQNATPEFQTPSHRDYRASSDTKSVSRQQDLYRNYTVPYDSPFMSPPGTIGKRRHRSEAATRTRTTATTTANQNYRAGKTKHTGSPFLSPPPPSRGAGPNKTKSMRKNTANSVPQKARPRPLVLDPSAGSLRVDSCNSEHRRTSLSTSASPSSSSPLVDIRGSGNGGKSSTVQKLFRVAAKGILDHHATAARYSTTDGSSMHGLTDAGVGGYLHSTPAATDVTGTGFSTAAALARSDGVAQAGFLKKLGKNIPEFKRRFFVLKPETNLYYFLSPNETEPRGKIDLEGSAIRRVERTPDGRIRFVVSFRGEGDDAVRKNNAHGNTHTADGEGEGEGSESDDIANYHRYQQNQQEIVLEARSTEIGEEWIRHITGERVSYLKDKSDSLASTITKQANQIADLERQIRHFKMIEADRDGALEDAQNWKNKFHRLDEALRLLTQQIRKSVTRSADKDGKSDAKAGGSEDKTDQDKGVNEKEESNANLSRSSSNEDALKRRDPESNKDTTPVKNNCAAALLDDLTNEDMDVEEILEVPGTYFSGLSNACQQQKESSRLASIEASAAVEDVLEANERVEVVQKRMHKAEKQILKLWEENCDIRKTLKQKKREKRVLVREVKLLQQTVLDLKDDIQQSSKDGLSVMLPPEEEGPMADTIIGSDEERLIIELEEHVASSIRLHERLVAGTDFDRDMEQSISTNPSSVHFDASTTDSVLIGGRSGSVHGELESSKTKLLSLFDDETDSDESTVQRGESKYLDSWTETQSSRGSVASFAGDTAVKATSLSHDDSEGSSSQRTNPLLKLDDEQRDEDFHNNPHYAKPSSSKLVTENGQATSRLVCPLADVRGKSPYGNRASRVDDDRNVGLQIYHLTFYSRKIGLQFQKTSPAPSKPRGLLTNAVTADLTKNAEGCDKTTAELRSVASITSLAKGEGMQGPNKQETASSRAVPEDIVLVCGFEGFDDSGANQRPKLGARLVAFDGVSVEVGKWTFESISKSIKARGRPLTLSFRNDYLTTEQRVTLTKAIKEVDAKRDAARPVEKYDRPVPAIPSLNSALSFESGHFLNNNDNANANAIGQLHEIHRRNEGKYLDRSTPTTVESNRWNRRPPSSSSSISTEYKDFPGGRLLPPPPSSSSTSTHRSRNSTTSTTSNGSSSAVSSLMNILVKKVSPSPELLREGHPLSRHGNDDEETSERSRRFGTGINPSGTRQHRDFQANLL